MPSTRTSHTTSRYFPLGSNGSSSATPRQRRVTRSSSTAQFKQSSPAAAKADAASQHEGSDAETGNLSFGSDIEDAIARTRKRRKITTTSVGIKTEAQRSTTTTTTGGSTKPATPRRARKPARKKTDPATGNVDVSPPSDWREMYDAVLAMRREGGVAAHAAVDTMGCERLADETASPRDQRFHTLVALMLSSQTKDTVNAVVMQRLKTELPAYKEGAPVGLNLENMLAVDAERLNEMIWAVGFHNNKTKYLKQTAIILRDKFNSDIPSTIEGLTSLPGVGPKMAYLCLSAAWDRTEGIGVDVHVHRITNLWGWHGTKTPEETRLALQSWLPRDRWREINWLLVGFGQTVCLPVGRRCGECELGLRGLCRAAERGKVARGKKEQLVKAGVEVDGVEVDGEAERKVKVEVEVEEEEVRQVKTEDADENGGNVEVGADPLSLPANKAKKDRRGGR